MQYHNVQSRQTDEYTNPNWCLGSGTVMLNGFSLDTSTCITYLFEPWSLNTKGKFAIACVGTFLLAISFQLLYFFREHLAKSARRRQRRENRPASLVEIGIQSLLFGVSATLGYFIMLLTMTFSTYLFIMVVTGLTTGHFLSSVALRRANAPHIAESVLSPVEDGYPIKNAQNTVLTGPPCVEGMETTSDDEMVNIIDDKETQDSSNRVLMSSPDDERSSMSSEGDKLQTGESCCCD